MQHDKRINTEDIEVHHIIPVKEDYDRRLDGDNLISLCREHHEAAEACVIKRDTLMTMAARQELSDNSLLPCL
jgi:predicted restriction endonuclease